MEGTGGNLGKDVLQMNYQTRTGHIGLTHKDGTDPAKTKDQITIDSKGAVIAQVGTGPNRQASDKAREAVTTVSSFLAQQKKPLFQFGR